MHVCVHFFHIYTLPLYVVSANSVCVCVCASTHTYIYYTFIYQPFYDKFQLNQASFHDQHLVDQIDLQVPAYFCFFISLVLMTF